MQLRTYRKTGHSSLAILALGSALAILYVGFGFAAALHAPGTATSWWLYLVMEIAFAAQIVLAIWGSWSLFRAFAARNGGDDLEINRPQVPIPEMAGRGANFPTNASDATFEMSRGGTLARLFRLWTLRRVDNIASLATERSVTLLLLISVTLRAGLDRLRRLGRVIQRVWHSGARPDGTDAISSRLRARKTIASAAAVSPIPDYRRHSAAGLDCARSL